ncbi:hypothetical protein ACSMXM_05675 [Pacificimonas sp. ICDLI1SI03]
MTDAARIAAIGDNGPPEPIDLTFETFKTAIDDQLLEAQNFLDGAGVKSEADAEAVSKILDELRRLSSDAEKARKAEKEPHLAAGRAVDDKWKALKEPSTMAVNAAKAALKPWLDAKEAEQRKAAEDARAEADRLQREAQEAYRKADADNLAARQEAERQRKDAEQAEIAANRAEKAKAHATGGQRAVGLRTVKVLHVDDERALAKHYWQAKHDIVTAFYRDLAEKDMRAGVAAIPGCRIKQERVL